VGPITLFDKSFLQSLSVDESVWFDHFFLTVVPPYFYVETLADLGKKVRPGRTPEQEVRIIADKFPEIHGTPCAFHVNLALENLEGYPVPMTGQIPMAGGRRVKSKDQKAVVWERSPEAKAFMRWQEGDFLDVERSFAQQWRQALTTFPIENLEGTLKAVGIGVQSARTLVEAAAVADGIISDTANSARLIALALRFLGASSRRRAFVLWQWSSAEYPTIGTYAPYAAFVLKVELFFQVAVSAGIISSARPSNRTDIAYLFYLPFSMLFVSSDRLHAKCAPLFLRPDQSFVWGGDLKKDLTQLNQHYSQLPDEVKEKGVFALVDTPPKDGDFLVARLWDKHLRPWRNRPEIPLQHQSRDGHEFQAELIQKINEIADAPDIPPAQSNFNSDEADAVLLKRHVRCKKGSWWQMPKDVKAKA